MKPNAPAMIPARADQARTLVRLHSERSALIACFSPADGCELSSLVVRDPTGGHELLYRGNDWRPVEGWAGRAPWLWPAAGRCYVEPAGAPAGEAGCGYVWNGRVYPMPSHGFIRHRVWRIQASAQRRLTARYDSGSPDQAVYPFDFALRLECELEGAALALRWTCEAAAHNDGSMPFNFGHHLTFDLRAWWGPDWWRGSLHAPADHGFTTDARMQLDRRMDLPAGTAGLTLDDPRLASLLIPAPHRSGVRLTSPDGRRVLELAIQAPEHDGEALWVLYRDPAGRFFCCEPWIGWPNALNSSRGRVDLPPGRSWQCAVSLAVHHTPNGSK